MTVNGVNGANPITMEQAVANLQKSGVTNPTYEQIQTEMLKGKQKDTKMGLEVETTGANQPKPAELTQDEKDIKAMLIGNGDYGFAGCKNQAELNQLLQELSAYPNLVADADVQAAIKAKKAELNPPPPKPAAPKQTRFDLNAEQAKLDKTETSGQTIQLQIDAEKTKQTVLQEAKAIDVESAKGFEAKHAAIVQQFIDVAVDDKKDVKTSTESLKNIASTKLTPEQKEALKAELQAIAGMNLEELCKDFGISVDTAKLANLGEDVTPEKVAEQLGYVNELLDQINGTEGEKPTGLAKVRADKAAADKNIANNNKTIAKYNQIYNDMVKNGEIKEGDPDPNNASVTQLQNANAEALKVVAKAESTIASITPLQTKLMEIQRQLSNSDTALDNIAKFDENAETKKGNQTMLEDKNLAVAEKDVTKSTEKRDKQVGKMTDAKFKNDANLNELEGSDQKANRKTDKKFEKVQTAQSQLSEDIKERNAFKAVVDDRNEKQKELDKLRGKEEVEQTP